MSVRFELNEKKKIKNMCLNPITIIPKYKKIYPAINNKIINVVNCGKCSECRKNYVNGLKLRAFNEMQVSKYVLFDTLTYNEKTVPWNYGIRTLQIEDYQKFIKRLRKALKGKKIKYLIGGEYGTSETGTHRPHYHILLFVKDEIDPIQLSKTIKKCWKNGLTDGVDDKGIYYFKNNRVFNGALANKNIVGYITKYMNKANAMDNIIQKKITNEIDTKYKCLQWQERKEIIKKEFKKYKQFIKWSHGFGEEYFKENIERYKNDYIDGLTTIITDYKNKYQIPLYYIRKLLYERNKQENEYRLTDEGLKIKTEKELKLIEKTKEKYIKNGYSLEDSLKYAQIEIKKMYRLNIEKQKNDYSIRYDVDEHGNIKTNYGNKNIKQIIRQLKEEYPLIEEINNKEYNENIEKNKLKDKNNNIIENYKKYGTLKC